LLLVCALGTMMCTLLAREAVSSEYRSLAALYRTAPDEAVSRVLQLPQAAHEKDVADAASVASDWPWDDLAPAAMLETDAALTHLHHDETAAVPYVEAAGRLLSRGLQTAPGQVAFVMRWYRGVAAVLRVNGALTLAQAIDRRRWDLTMRQPLFGRALDVLASGIASEYTGCVQGDAVAGDPPQFASAARDLTEALTIDPALLDAALHLGRIRMLEGDASGAARLFASAASSPSRSTAYLARLFLGSVSEAASDWDEAERHYRDAHSILPAGQAAALSLAALLDRRGLLAESASTIGAMLDGTGVRQIADPWSAYFGGLGRDPDVILRALRAEVSR